MKHAELLERLRVATEGDRDLDAEVAVALGHVIKWKTANYTMEQFPAIYWKAPHPYAGMCEPCPAFTTSLDAAVALCERVLPGWHWSLHQSQIAQVCPCDEYGSIIERLELEEFGRTPALALCIAILSALSVDIGDDAQANECLTKES